MERISDLVNWSVSVCRSGDHINYRTGAGNSFIRGYQFQTENEVAENSYEMSSYMKSNIIFLCLGNNKNNIIL